MFKVVFRRHGICRPSCDSFSWHMMRMCAWGVWVGGRKCIISDLFGFLGNNLFVSGLLYPEISKTVHWAIHVVWYCCLKACMSFTVVCIQKELVYGWSFVFQSSWYKVIRQDGMFKMAAPRLNVHTLQLYKFMAHHPRAAGCETAYCSLEILTILETS